MIFLPVLFLTNLVAGQDLPPVSAATDYARLHDGLKPPQLIHPTDPEYTPQAIEGGIEGSVVVQAVIDKTGKVTYASILSPLPAGLDAKALEAIRHWRYTPGVMDNEIVPVLTTIDVVFRLPYSATNPATDQKRAAFQQKLKQEFANGKAALATNPAEARKLIGDAAFLGNVDAQRTIGDLNEREGNLNEAKHYFRMCAATSHSDCEYRLGKLLVSGPGLNPNDFTQGVTWLELGKEHGNRDAAARWSAEVAKLSSIQLDWVLKLKPHLELRNYRGF